MVSINRILPKAKNLPLILNTKHLDKLRKHCATSGLVFNQQELENVYSFWIDNICIATHYDKHYKLANQTEMINKILFDTAPDMMFVNTDEMKERFDKFFQLGFLNNRDKLFVFREAPRGWFLQDWRKFSTKFNYIQYRIMPWILKREDDEFPEPHPLIRSCKALELSYDHIKSRFLWVSSAGVGPSKLNDAGGDKLIPWKVVHNLLLTDNRYFLNLVTPSVKLPEYEFFEMMVEQTEAPEDEIMDCLSDLTKQEASRYLAEHEDEDIQKFSAIEHIKLKKAIK